MPSKSGSSVVWTGKNLAEMKRLHKDVAHYPEDAKAEPFHRDASQHPDNLHLTTDDGHTLVVALGDTVTRDADGRLTVQQTAKQRPQATPVEPTGRQVKAEGNDTSRTRGRGR